MSGMQPTAKGKKLTVEEAKSKTVFTISNGNQMTHGNVSKVGSFIPSTNDSFYCESETDMAADAQKSPTVLFMP